MMRVLLDTDVILDVFLKREPFAEAAAELWRANEQRLYEGYVSAITPVNLFYIARKIKDAAVAHAAVTELLMAFHVCPIDRLILQAALALSFRDYEDAVQHMSAAASQLDAIVTRDAQDYAQASLPILSPIDFLKQLTSQADR
jgi:predicted nucleic acid-binding protein